METVSLVIAEHGGNWLPWARKLRAHKDRIVVLVQAEDEAASQFARRVIQRLRTLRQEGVRVPEAALVAGAQHDDPGLRHQRSKIVRKLSALLSESSPDGHLYLDPAAAGDNRARNLMEALAWALRDMTRGSGLSIQVAPSFA